MGKIPVLLHLAVMHNEALGCLRARKKVELMWGWGMLHNVRQVTASRPCPRVPSPTTDWSVAVWSDLPLGKPGVGPVCYTLYSEDRAIEYLTFPGQVLFLLANLFWAWLEDLDCLNLLSGNPAELRCSRSAHFDVSTVYVKEMDTYTQRLWCTSNSLCLQRSVVPYTK